MNDATNQSRAISPVKRVRYVVALLVAVAAIASVGAHAASASNCGNGGCDLFRLGPSNGYYFTTPGGVVIGMICWKDSTWYAGTNRWFYVSTIFGDGWAWVSANQVKNQIVVRHC
jgi:hypothetical protein